MSNLSMMKLAALSAALLILTACAPRLPEIEPGPVSIDPQVCVPIPPEPEPAGSIVAPVTPEERSATRDHLSSDVKARAWGRDGWAIVAIAQKDCVT